MLSFDIFRWKIYTNFNDFFDATCINSFGIHDCHGCQRYYSKEMNLDGMTGGLKICTIC